MKFCHKKLAVLLSLQMIFGPAHALTWVRSTGVDPASFRGILRAHGQGVSVLDKLVAQRPAGAAHQELLRLFERAQKEYLTGSLEQAQALFLQIEGKAFDQDWNEAGRKIIFYAILRLAQARSEGSERDQFIVKAIAFTPDETPESDVFPPPLIERFIELKASLKNQVVSWRTTQARDYEILLLDGRQIYLKDFTEVKIWPGTHRMTFLSSAFKSVETIGDEKQLASFSPVLQVRLVEGNCESPHLNLDRHDKDDVYVVFSDECVRRFEKGKWLAQNTNPDLKPNDETAATTEANSVPTLVTEPNNEKKWYHNKWVWIGGGVLLAGIVGYAISSNQSGSGGSTTVIEPTHR